MTLKMARRLQQACLDDTDIYYSRQCELETAPLKEESLAAHMCRRIAEQSLNKLCILDLTTILFTFLPHFTLPFHPHYTTRTHDSISAFTD